jgi:hypothetical protein
MGRNLWPGMIIGRMTDEKGADEIINQIMIERGFVPDGPGHVHFSMKAFMKDSSALNAGLKNGPYQKQALVPTSPWLDDVAPSAPKATATMADDSTVVLSWSHANTIDVFRWVVYYQYGKSWDYRILNEQDRMLAIPTSRTVVERPRARQREVNTQVRVDYLTRIAVSAVDRLGNESELATQTVASPPAPAVK